jgi:hypothetical protein
LLEKEETKFWQELIEKYLKPLDHDKEYQKQASISSIVPHLRNTIKFVEYLVTLTTSVTKYFPLTDASRSARSQEQSVSGVPADERPFCDNCLRINRSQCQY